MQSNGIELAFLGGLGEIGMNCTLMSSSAGAVLLDSGMAFPRRDLPGPDYLIPDLRFLEEVADSLEAVVITHGHEDHIGGIPYLLQRFEVPVYAPPFALELIKAKLEERGMETRGRLHPLHPRQRLALAGMEFEFIRVTHSIPDALAVAIRTEEGIILHTGDFRIDENPTRGEPFQAEAFERLGEEGVALLLSDSTNIDAPGRSRPEQEVATAIEELVADWEGRVMVTLFASNVYRVGQLHAIAARQRRRLCLVGRSLHNYLEAAARVHQAPFNPADTVDMSALDQVPDERLLIAMTGSQGEPRSALARLADENHPHLFAREGDLILFSSRIIPGNELDIQRMSNGLCRSGADVVTSRTHPIHTTGHACREELADVLRWVRPRAFVPVHGEYGFLDRHARLAEEVCDADVLVAENGDRLVLRRGRVDFGEPFEFEPLYVEGPLIGTDEELKLRERKRLLYHGVIMLDVRGGDVPSVAATLLGVPDPDGSLKEQVEDLALETWRDRPKHLSGEALRDELALAVRRHVRRSRERKPAVVVSLP